MTNSQLIAFLLTCLISICVYYFKKLDTKIDNLTDSKYSHETRILILEKDIKQLQTINTKP